jgi:hypothetical protein
MGAKRSDPVKRVRGALTAKKAGVSKVASAPVRAGGAAEGDIAEGFRRARGAVGEVASDIKQLRGRAGSLVKKAKPRK